MDKNNLIGFILIALILFVYSYVTQPSAEELERQQFVQDSIKTAKRVADSLAKVKALNPQKLVEDNPTQRIEPDSTALKNEYGRFAAAMKGENKTVFLENDLFKIAFDTKGGKIKYVELLKYKKATKNKEGKTEKVPLRLLEDKKNEFEYSIPIKGDAGVINTADLYFKPSIDGKVATFRASAGEGKYIEQRFEIEDGNYMFNYDLNLVGLNTIIPRAAKSIELNWVNYLDKIEKNDYFESTYTSAYYRRVERSPDNCSCTGNDEIAVNKPVQWISHAQQFFNTTLIANNNFDEAIVATEMMGENSVDLKKLTSKAFLAYDNNSSVSYPMRMYVGPNDFDILRSYDIELEEIIPFGWGIFRSINKWLIHPMFKFLSSFIGQVGIVIVLLTFIVKMLVYPLTYRMLYSQAKMQVLKPQLDALKKKVGDDQQAMQLKQMELYRETGVNPLGGCWPMLLQIPIWYALFRFFPASIDFRQQSFLWADDLSSYDSILEFGYIPLIGDIYGTHISLFTILWAATTVMYSMYNMKNMSMPTAGGANAQMMKYMQYAMPVMFLFFFNNYAAGLTCYMLFSNVFNISQTYITKNFIINKGKVAAELEANKKKPKKKGGFQDRLQEAMRQQQEITKKQQEQAKQRRRTTRRRTNKK